MKLHQSRDVSPPPRTIRKPESDCFQQRLAFWPYFLPKWSIMTASARANVSDRRREIVSNNGRDTVSNNGREIVSFSGCDIVKPHTRHIICPCILQRMTSGFAAALFRYTPSRNALVYYKTSLYNTSLGSSILRGGGISTYIGMPTRWRRGSASWPTRGPRCSGGSRLPSCLQGDSDGEKHKNKKKLERQRGKSPSEELRGGLDRFQQVVGSSNL